MNKLSQWLVTFVIVCGLEVPADADVFTPAEKNVEAVMEAAVMSTSKLIQEYGFAEATLSFSGTFGDSGWSADLSGLYDDTLFQLSYTGNYNQLTDSGYYSSQGAYGTATWAGSGQWSFIDIDPTTEGMFWDSEATVTPLAGPEKKPDKHFTQAKTWGKTEDETHEFWSDYGKYKDTEDGVIVGEEKEEMSDYVIPKDGPRVASVSVTLPDDLIWLDGFADFDYGTVGAMITVVPESATLWLLALGVLMATRRRRR